METRQIKAYGFRGTLEFIEKSYDQGARDRIFSALTPPAREFVELSKKAHHADPLHSSELWTAMVKEHPNAEDARLQLVKCGRHMGSYATSTYLRLLMKVLTVRLFARKFPDIWARDANFGKVHVEGAEIDSGKAIIHHTELANYPYFGPICQGWYEFSFETMGLKALSVTTLDWSMTNPDPGELRYQLRWTP